MAYWAEVARRAWIETAKTVKLDSRKLLMVLVLGQVVIGTILYLALGVENLPGNVLARGATIAAPFLLFVPLFIWEFISSPPKMLAEQVALLHRASVEKDKAQAAITRPSGCDSTILNLQEENAALRAQVSELRHSTDADYPFDMRQRTALVAFLSKFPAEARFVVAVRHSGLSGSSDYARRMARAFREAGWDAQVTPDLMIQPTNEGVHLASCRASTGELDPLSANGELLRDALNEAEIKFSLSGHAWPDDLEKPSSLFFVFPPGV